LLLVDEVLLQGYFLLLLLLLCLAPRVKLVARVLLDDRVDAAFVLLLAQVALKGDFRG
jgi:hypothetical protein